MKYETLGEQIAKQEAEHYEWKQNEAWKKSLHVFKWCSSCQYYRNCYDDYGGPYFLEPNCSEGQIQE